MDAKRLVFFSFFTFGIFPQLSLAGMPSQPETDPDFLDLPDGRNLSSFQVSGTALGLARGEGHSWTIAQQAEFEQIRSESKADALHPVQWVLMDLDAHSIVDQSAGTNLKQFGASVSKIFVAATLMDKQEGTLSASQLQLMADMLVVSSNTAWTELQNQIGEGDSDRGRERIHYFTQRMGYERTRGFQGYWGEMHGNELTPKELAEFLYDTYQNHYFGAETVWKILHTSRTGEMRAKKYLPATQYVGGKTGTYDGATVDPETGKSTDPDGKPYTVQVRHQVIVFHLEGHEYGLAILANTGSDESAAALAGGLYRELASSR